MARRKSKSRPYRFPPIVDAGIMPLPEKRADVVKKMLGNLSETKTVFRQNYSNGEFITSSTIIGKTFADVSDRALDLECAGNSAYFDDKLEIWWRTGGSFD